MIKKISAFLYYHDPTGEYFFKALMMTLAGALTTLLWLFTQKPFGALTTWLPQFFVFVSFTAVTHRERAFRVFVFFILTCFAAFLMSSLQSYKLIIVVIMFIIGFIIYSNNRLLFMASCLWIFTMMIQLPPGFYQGINRVFEISAGLIISILVIIADELFLSKKNMYNTLKHTIELINDLFVIYTSDKTSSSYIFKNQYLYKKENLFNTKISTSNIFETKKDRFYNRVYFALSKLDNLIYSKEYLFYSDKIYSEAISDIYIFYRRLSRDIEFLNCYSEMKESIGKHLKETFEIVENIHSQLLSLKNISIEDNIIKENLKDNELTKKWLSKLDLLIADKNIKINKSEWKIYYGIKCILNNLEYLRKKYNNKNLIKQIRF